MLLFNQFCPEKKPVSEISYFYESKYRIIIYAILDCSQNQKIEHPEAFWVKVGNIPFDPILSMLNKKIDVTKLKYEI